MYQAARCLNDGGWRLKSRICSDLNTVTADQTTAAGEETPLRISAQK